MAIKPVSVSQLNSYIGRVLNTDPILCSIAVKGEISKLTKHSSGHWYFTLKDENSKINCFCSSFRVGTLRFDISDGMEIIAYGNVSVYETGGTYSLNIKDIEVEGEGNLKLAFENLKRKLEAEGLFDTSHKRPIPKDPKRIGVVTSPTGAAIKDIISTIQRRNPTVDILLYPALVQGSGSADSICLGINTLNQLFPDLDLLIVGRGGGSAEDLWSFNEESVVRAVYNSKIPVISAVGHEVDYVITDYAADLRGATPTAAAELAAPHIESLKDRLNHCNPQRMYSYLNNIVSEYEYKLKILKIALDGFNPANILDKGYGLIMKDNKIVSSSKELTENDVIFIKFNDGTVKASIIN